MTHWNWSLILSVPFPPHITYKYSGMVHSSCITTWLNAGRRHNIENHKFHISSFVWEWKTDGTHCFWLDASCHMTVCLDKNVGQYTQYQDFGFTSFTSGLQVIWILPRVRIWKGQHMELILCFSPGQHVSVSSSHWNTGKYQLLFSFTLMCFQTFSTTNHTWFSHWRL